MSAKEMFEKLGYVENSDSETCLRYTKKDYEEIIEIIFFLNNKVFRKRGEEIVNFSITMPELQAINKQVEELGWNER